MNREWFQWALAAFLASFASLASGQLSSQLGMFDYLPQRVVANPALAPEGRINVGLPFLSNVYFEGSSNWLRHDQYLRADANGVGRVDYATLLNDIGEEAFTGYGTSLELVHVGFKLGEGYVHARVTERVQGAIGLPRDMLALGVYGNVGPNGFSNSTADLSQFRVDFTHFREYAIGYSRPFMEKKLRVGATAKLLYGLETVRTAESSLQLRTDPLTYDLTTSGSLLVNTAGLGLGEKEQDIREDVGRYLFGLGNRGLGIDVGASYEPIERLRLEFSANDFGFINWRTDVANYGTTSADFAYRGVDFTDFIFLEGSDFDNALEDELDGIADEAQEAYNFEGSYNNFRTGLFGYFRYAASYDVLKNKVLKGSVWASMMHSVGHSNLPTRLTVGYNQLIWRHIQIGAHYTRQHGDGGFLGGGISLNAGPAQIFVMVENFNIARFSRYTIVDSDGNRDRIVLPTNPSDLRVHLGINLTFGRPLKDDDGKSVPLIR